MPPITIKFTPTEWSLIADRLQVPCAIAECLTGDDETLDHDAVHDSAYKMALNGPEITVNTEIDLAVLVDAVEGSTMPYKLKDAVQYGCESEAKIARSMLRHISKIETKLAAAGISAKFPKG